MKKRNDHFEDKGMTLGKVRTLLLSVDYGAYRGREMTLVSDGFIEYGWPRARRAIGDRTLAS